jgi:oxygen-dependent protoporphyrinogen oxidase
VPRREGLRVRACTFVGQKFRHRVPPEQELVRCFLGASGDRAVLEWSDEELLTEARQELRRLVRVTAEPLAARVARWPRALPQYTVGHLGRVETIQKRLAAHRGLYLAGNACDGIGVSDSIRAGRQAAAACLRLLGAGS